MHPAGAPTTRSNLDCLHGARLLRGPRPLPLPPQMQTELAHAVAGAVVTKNDAEPLQRLAAELILTAGAASAGTVGYVVGRSHAGCGPRPARFLPPSRRCEGQPM